MPATGYVNAFGKVLYESGATTKGFLAPGAGQTVTGTNGNDGLRTAGSATLIGGLGDDTYYVYTRNDAVVEKAGEGTDTIVSTATWYKLSDNVENLTVTGKNATGIGNALDNIIKGGAGSQTLYGGAGNDVLIGGGDADTFVVAKGEGSDVIQDFQAGVDRLRLDDYSHLNSFAAVQAAMTQVGADVVINLGKGETVTLRNQQMSTLSADDFLLPKSMSGQKLTFSDDFNSFDGSPTPVKDDWQTAWNGKGTTRTLSANHEAEYYSDSSVGVNPFSVHDGVLDITATRATPGVETPAASGLTWTSGMIRSYGSFAQLYGYFEIRAELPAGKGFWPAFWLVRQDGVWPPELDVFEMLGDDPSTIYVTAHTKSSGKHTSESIPVYVGDTSEGFHTYGVDWGPQKIVYYFDGNAIAEIDTPADMHSPMYMIANLAVGDVGSWPGATDSSTPSTAHMLIDYIRAYQYDPNAPTTPPVNNNPVANADLFNAQRNKTLTINVADLLANDIDIDGDTLSITSVSAGAHGSVALKNGQVIFTPEAGYVGPAGFSYVLGDGEGGSATGQVQVMVAAPKNNNPVATLDSFVTQYNSALKIKVADLLANDRDADGDSLSIVSVSAGAHGTVTLKNGEIIFTPEAGYAGPADFTYLLSDGQGGAATGQAQVAIEASKPVIGAQYLNLISATQSCSLNLSEAAGQQTIRGSERADQITGALNFTNALNGGGGDDTIIGGNMKDVITGGVGADIMTGGGGDDTFIINKGDLAHLKNGDAFDIITDFEGAGRAGGDMIRFQGFSSNAALNYVGDIAGHPNQHIYQVDDGAYHAQFVVQSDGLLGLQKGDFGFYS